MNAAGPSPQAALSLLQAWRESGAWQMDPARFHTLEAIARRMASQAPQVQALLHTRLAAGVAEFARRLAEAPPHPVATTALPAPRAAARPPLADLLAWIRQALAQRPGNDSGDELASVRAFRDTWSRVHAQEQVARAAAAKPPQAGPLNSQVLALDALALMAEVSPSYLRRFMAYAESLQWLEAAGAQARPAPEKTPRRKARGTRRPPAGGASKGS